MREALRGLRPERLADVIAMVSLYRPGPMELIPDFIERRHGRAKITYEHPAMEALTRETYGIMVYEEQIMQIASEMAGFTMGEADTLRRAMGKKDRELMAKQREKFIAGCAERSISKAKADRVWELMEKFAGYGFNKCVTGDTRIEMADGSCKRITEIADGDVVLTKDGPFEALGVRPSGLRRVGRLELANGTSVRCTPDHPIFTHRGWVNAGDLTRDDFVAVARELPCGREVVPEHLSALLGYALAEGGLGYESHFYLYSTVADEIEDMRSVVAKFSNTRPTVEHRPKGKASSVRPVRMDRARPSEAVTFLFEACGLQGKTATLVGLKRRALDQLVASYAGTKTLLARGTVDVIPAALYRDPLREAIRKRYPTLKGGCRELGIAYGLLFNDRRKRGIRRETLAWLAERLDAPALHTLVDQSMGWSRPKRFVLEGVEPTYDFEVPRAKSFLANGIAVHNSHAAAYALVAYQTAYFKANYPVEFMAALLTSEMGDTDKIVTYIEECRAMGIGVDPPDVNVSAVRFSVAGDTVRFCLAAIKDVGQAAIESILQARAAGGVFASLEDFCARVDLRLVNRRVLEPLIKAGAFDSLGLTRAHLLATVDGALESGQRNQRDPAEGPASLFDLLPAPSAAPGAQAVGGAPGGGANHGPRFGKRVLGVL